MEDGMSGQGELENNILRKKVLFYLPAQSTRGRKVQSVHAHIV